MFGLFKKKEKKIVIEKANIENDMKISFADINLEVYVRKLINREKGDIFLSDVYNIKKLDFLGWPLIDIRGMQHMLNAEYLNLYYSRMTNITYLKYLTKLKYLNLSWIDSLSELKSISELRDLEELIVSYSPRVGDFSVISNIKSLKVLDLSENRLNNISYIEELYNLEELYLSKNNLNTVDFSNMKNLKILDISANKVKDISSLNSYNHLEVLDLSVNQIEDISILKNFTNLKKIDLRSNNIDYKLAENKESLNHLKSIRCKIKK